MFIKDTPEISKYVGAVSSVKRFTGEVTNLGQDQTMVIEHIGDSNFMRRVSVLKWVTDHYEWINGNELQNFEIIMNNDNTTITNTSANIYDKIILNVAI